MRFVMFAVITAALAVPAQAEERATAGAKPTLAAQGQAILATPEYSQGGGWQARVSKAGSGRGSTKRSVLLGALIGGAAGLVTGAVFEHQMCACGLGSVTALGTGIGAGGGAAVGWALSLR